MRPCLTSLIVAALLSSLLLLPACDRGDTTDAVVQPPASTGSAEETATDGQPTMDTRQLVLDRCTSCHDVTRIKEAQYDMAGWEATVDRMRKTGARVDDAEAAEIVGFLAAGGASQL